MTIKFCHKANLLDSLFSSKNFRLIFIGALLTGTAQDVFPEEALAQYSASTHAFNPIVKSIYTFDPIVQHNDHNNDFNSSAHIANVKSFGAKGDGLANDTTAIANSIKSIQATNGGILFFPPGTYNLGRLDANSQKGLPLPSNTLVIGYGAKIDMISNASAFEICPEDTSISSTIKFSISNGSNYIYPEAPNKFKKGDLVFLRLGQAKYDQYETSDYQFANITAIESDKILLSTFLPGLKIEETPEPQRKIIKIVDRKSHIKVEGLTFFRSRDKSSAQYESAVKVLYGTSIEISNCNASNCGAGLLTAQFSENISCVNCSASGIEMETPSKGKAFGFAECRNIYINNVSVSDYEANEAILFEANCLNVSIDNLITNPRRTGKFIGAIGCLGMNLDEISIGNLTIPANTWAIIGNQNKGRSLINTLSIIGWNPYESQPNDNNGNFLLGDSAEINKLSLTNCTFRKSTLRIRIDPGTYSKTTIKLPPGITVSTRVICDDFTGIDSLFIGRDDNSSNSPNLLKYNDGKICQFYHYIESRQENQINSKLNLTRRVIVNRKENTEKLTLWIEIESLMPTLITPNSDCIDWSYSIVNSN